MKQDSKNEKNSAESAVRVEETRDSARIAFRPASGLDPFRASVFSPLGRK
jgi:hypothetical protein